MPSSLESERPEETVALHLLPLFHLRHLQVRFVSVKAERPLPSITWYRHAITWQCDGWLTPPPPPPRPPRGGPRRRPGHASIRPARRRRTRPKNRSCLHVDQQTRTTRTTVRSTKSNWDVVSWLLLQKKNQKNKQKQKKKKKKKKNTNLYWKRFI